jgi:hypothetical protein
MQRDGETPSPVMGDGRTPDPAVEESLLAAIQGACPS